jgi:hypothetical protein
MFSCIIVQKQFRLPVANHTVRKIGPVFVLFMQLLLLIPTCKSIQCFVSSMPYRIAVLEEVKVG